MSLSSKANLTCCFSFYYTFRRGPIDKVWGLQCWPSSSYDTPELAPEATTQKGTPACPHCSINHTHICLLMQSNVRSHQATREALPIPPRSPACAFSYLRHSQWSSSLHSIYLNNRAFILNWPNAKLRRLNNQNPSYLAYCPQTLTPSQRHLAISKQFGSVRGKASTGNSDKGDMVLRNSVCSLRCSGVVESWDPFLCPPPPPPLMGANFLFHLPCRFYASRLIHFRKNALKSWHFLPNKGVSYKHRYMHIIYHSQSRSGFGDRNISQQRLATSIMT